MNCALVEFDNEDTKGKSGNCHARFCTGKDAVCTNNACCTCRCTAGMFYNGSNCVSCVTTQRPSSPSSAAFSSSKSKKTTKVTSAGSSPSTSKSSTTLATTVSRQTTIQKFSSTLSPGTFPASKSSSTVLSSSQRTSNTHYSSSFSSSSKYFPGTSTAFSSSVGSASIQRKPTSTLLSPTSRLTTTKKFSGVKEKVSTDGTSNTGLVVGLCLGILAIIICVLVLLYLRRGKKQFKGIKKFNKELCHVDITSLNGNPVAGSPTSPGYDYAYTQPRPGPNGSIPPAGLMGNPVYDNDLRVAGQLHDRQETDQKNQPVYQELVEEQVYADPNSNQGGGGEPVYRIVDDNQMGEGSVSDPIYREVDEPPLYAETIETPVRPEGATRGPMQYQELNYSTRNNMYQPLADDWKSEKYQRDD